MKKLYLILLLLIVCVSLQAQMIQSTTVRKFPITEEESAVDIAFAHYKFEQNITDTEGSYNGTAVGTPTYQTYSGFGGYVTYGLSSSNYFTLPSIAYGDHFSITWRLLVDDGWLLDADRCIIDGITGTGFGNGFEVIFNGGGAATITVLTANGSGDFAIATSSNASLSDLTIYNFAVVVNRASGTCKIYANGTDITSASNEVRTDFGNTRAVSVCNEINGLWGYTAFPHQFDELQLYNVELTSTEVTWQQSNPNTIVTR
jgi:hypothetical protein